MEGPTALGVGIIVGFEVGFKVGFRVGGRVGCLDGFGVGGGEGGGPLFSIMVADSYCAAQSGAEKHPS